MLSNIKPNDDFIIMAGTSRFKLNFYLRKNNEFLNNHNYVISTYQFLRNIPWTREYFSGEFAKLSLNFHKFQDEFFHYKQKFPSLPTRRLINLYYFQFFKFFNNFSIIFY